MRGPSTRTVLLLVVGWAGVVMAGHWTLWRYKQTAAPEVEAAAGWPEGSAIARAEGRFTLVMAAHPHCPCTTASVSELARLMSRLDGRVPGHVLIMKPDGASDDWLEGPIWSAARIPGITAIADEGGLEAARFGAKTSGHVMLYDPEGRLAFSGGITSARGHEGDNAGSGRIFQIVTAGGADSAQSAIYGCGLKDAQSSR